MHPIYLFILAGAFAMSGALSARELIQQTMLVNKTQAEQDGEQPDVRLTEVKTTGSHTPKSTLAWYYLLSGNLAVVGLLITMVHGFQTFAWWISVACLVVSFPALHYIVLQRLLSAKLRILLYPAIAWIILIPVITNWLF